MILKQLKTAVIVFGLLAILTGLLYPMLITGISQVLFPYQANGSLITRNGQVIGSALIGQQFSDPRYFWGRPSATGDHPYNASASGGTNFSALNPNLEKQVKDRLAALKAADPDNHQPVPVDLVTSSASGLDPDISIAAARYQATRVARLRGLPANQVLELIDQHTQKRIMGFLGEPRLNVMELNLALDRIQ
jgi:potassium-transporting ATPase KdpC subunit